MPPRNGIGDLVNTLFGTLERLDDEEMDDGQLDREIKRAKAISGVAGQILDAARLELDAVKVADDLGMTTDMPGIFRLEAPKGGQHG